MAKKSSGETTSKKAGTSASKVLGMTGRVRTRNRQPGQRSHSAPTKVVENRAVAAKSSRGTWVGGGRPLMPRYRPGDHVLVQFHRYELLRFQLRTGAGSPPPFEVIRVLPAGHDGEHSSQVRCPFEPHARVAKEHELAPAG